MEVGGGGGGVEGDTVFMYKHIAKWYELSAFS